jgi:biotin carboxyl carrier protein
MTDKVSNSENNKKFKILVINDARYKTRYTKKFEDRIKYVEPDARKVVTSIPGTVVEILVKKGQAVNKGDDLIILEAMKMNTRIKSPISGTIKFININQGQCIPKGRLILEIS